MLNDRELNDRFRDLLGQEPPADPYAKDSRVQPASIDLTIGDIYLPGVKPNKSGGVKNPKTSHSLEAGHTAVIYTRETINLSNDLGAIGFPPTDISDNGILMTNPGHVDPGYEGGLSFTVINMGREPFPLQRGNLIVTLVFFKLDAPSSCDYSERHPAPVPPLTPDQEQKRLDRLKQQRLDRLAPDMLDVNERIRKITKSAENKTRRVAIWVPLALAAVVALGTYFGPQVTDWQHNFDDYRSRLAVLEERSKTQNDLQARLNRVEQQVEELKARLAAEEPNNGRG
jgi:dCTP deaminase